MAMRIPPLKIKILLESNPLKSRILVLVRRLAVAARNLGGGKVDATIGSALDCFGGRLPYADVLAWHHKQQERLLNLSVTFFRIGNSEFVLIQILKLTLSAPPQGLDLHPDPEATQCEPTPALESVWKGLSM